MKYQTMLITGGAGFIGSNLAVSFKQKYPKLKVIALDNLKRRGSELNVTRLKGMGVEFMHGDIRCPEDMVIKEDIDLIIECSAEPSVLAGYGENPAYIINTNLAGTVNCLELARKNKADVIFLSTSRVYPFEALNKIKTRETETRFEWAEGQSIEGWSVDGVDINFSLEGAKTLYGATKLCSEIILQEYVNMYGLHAVINRCGVIAGPWQFGKVDQGIFTFWMLAHYFKQELQYIGFGGKGKQVRDLLHVDDLFELLDLQISSLEIISGKVYNIGGSRQVSLSLLETTGLCEKVTGNPLKIGKELRDRPGDVAVYLSDNAKAARDLGWSPKKNPEDILRDIYRWIKDNEQLLKRQLL